MNIRHLAVLSLVVLSLGSLHAQDQPTSSDTETNRSFWEAKLPGGEYLVKLGRISSISHHKYVIEGGITVTEVVVDTQGSVLARFYHLSLAAEEAPNSVGGALKRGRKIIEDNSGRTGVDVGSKVTKQYPITTHAKTVEYRLSSEAKLKALYASLRLAWERNRGRTFTAK